MAIPSMKKNQKSKNIVIVAVKKREIVTYLNGNIIYIQPIVKILKNNYMANVIYWYIYVFLVLAKHGLLVNYCTHLLRVKQNLKLKKTS